jgi:hypothetical protein
MYYYHFVIIGIIVVIICMYIRREYMYLNVGFEKKIKEIWSYYKNHEAAVLTCAVCKSIARGGASRKGSTRSDAQLGSGP